MPVHAYIGMGGNLGEVRETFRRAIASLRAKGVPVIAVAPAYRTEAMLAPGASEPQPPYWNTVAKAPVNMSPHDLLKIMLQVEGEQGRVRTARWASRTLDLDLLLFGEQRIHDAVLRVPHPGVAERVFVRAPLQDIFAAEGRGLSGYSRGDGILEVDPQWSDDPPVVALSS